MEYGCRETALGGFAQTKGFLGEQEGQSIDKLFYAGKSRRNPDREMLAAFPEVKDGGFWVEVV
jgi:hypothetical protein